MSEWKFSEAPNAAVVTTKKIIGGDETIKYVVHDKDDGGWQFLDGERVDENEAAVVSLQNIVDIDETVSELSDLPIGWHAWREGKDSAWQRASN